MIKESSRKAKIETVKSLLSGTKTVRDLRQDQGLTVLLEYAECSEAPGVFYDRQGRQLTADQIGSQATAKREAGYLVFSETRTYNSKNDLYGFIQKQKG